MEEIRKESLEAVRKFGYAANENLPLLDEEMKAVRDAREIADRVNILHLLYTTSLEGERSISFFFGLIQKNGWTKHLTETELRYFRSGKQSKAEEIKYSWYKESIYALLWATGLVKDLRDLQETDMATIYPLIPPEANEEKFLKSLKLRKEKDLLRELDFFYLMHWSAKHGKSESKLFGLFSKKKPDLSVISERRHALEWLFTSSDWEDVSMDT